MNKCKHLKKEDITTWHGDVFDHPSYRYICTLTGNEVFPNLRCHKDRCKNYKQGKETDDVP